MIINSNINQTSNFSVNNKENQQVLERLQQQGLGKENGQVAKKQAGVLCLLFEEHDELKVWLTKRSMNMSQHPGDVALPGGKRDPVDTDIIDTAKREAFEEIGLKDDQFEVLMSLPPILSHFKYSVTTVVAKQLKPFEIALSQKEVDQIFVVPLRTFIQQAGYSYKDLNLDDLLYRVHFFDFQGHTIWGLTAQILIQVAMVAYNESPKFIMVPKGGIDYWNLYYDEDLKKKLVKKQ